MSKRKRREWEIPPRGPTDDDLARAATPELRKQMERMQKLAAYNFEHPMDPRPMREAEARAAISGSAGDIGLATEQALLFGLELGRREGLFGVDAIEGRRYLEQQRANSGMSVVIRTQATMIRHAKWRADMEALHSKHQSWSGRRLAMRLAESYRTTGVPDSPSFKCLANLWVKWRPRG